MARIFHLTVAQFAASLISRWYAIAELRIVMLPRVDPLSVIAATRQDITVALIAATAAIVIHSAVGMRWPNFAPRLLLAFAVAHCLLLGMNAFAVWWIGAPLTLQWLYFADLFQTATPRAAVAAVASTSALTFLAFVTTLPLVTLWLARRVFPLPQRQALLSGIAASVMVVAMLFALSALIRPFRGDLFKEMQYSPVRALLVSLLSRPRLLSECGGNVSPDALIFAPPLPAIANSNGGKPNVVLVVLESVGAKALEANRPRLPTLDRLMRSGSLFPNAYTTTASTTRSLFSLLASRYPLVSFRPETRVLGKVDFVALPEVLESVGYRTGFFGVDLEFQDADRFIRSAGFDIAQDELSGDCRRAGRPAPGDYPAYAIPDPCIFESAAAWAATVQQPFFVMVWSNDTHAPYTTHGNLAGRLTRDNYERGLITTDHALRGLMDRLARAARLDNSILVIVGDHGESFGEHGRRFHGTTIFEEEVRVPLIFHGNPLGRQGTDPRLARLIDVAPTILSLAGRRPEREWNGVDLFSGRAINRAFFFSSYRGIQMGLREGSTKYVLDYGEGSFAKYRLDQDRAELRPIPLNEREKSRAERLVAGWAARERDRYKSLRRDRCER